VVSIIDLCRPASTNSMGSGESYFLEFKAMKFSLFLPLRRIRHLVGMAPYSVAKANFIFGHKRETPRAYLDVTSLHYADHGGGIQRVQKALLANFAKIENSDYDFIPVFFCGQEKRFKRFVEATKRSSAISNAIREKDIDFCTDDVYLNLDLNYDFYIENLTLLQELKRRGIHRFTIIYDLLPISMPAMFPNHVPQLHSTWVRIAAEYTTPICISRHVKEELHKWTEDTLEKDEIEVIELGGGIASYDPQDATEFYSNSNLSLHFLVVSTIEPRKCHDQVLRAFEILWNEGEELSLTLVGQQGWDTEEVVEKIVNHPLNGKNLFWFPKISDSDLGMLYQNSSALINASLGEGFGLPLREAIMHKLPLILRDIDVFREVAGDGAWFFVADSPKALANSIRDWMKVYKSGEIEVVLPAKFPAWEDTCSQINKIIQERTVNS